jgi:hypothetical protein
LFNCLRASFAWVVSTKHLSWKKTHFIVSQVIVFKIFNLLKTCILYTLLASNSKNVYYVLSLHIKEDNCLLKNQINT